MLCLVNQERAARGLAPVVREPRLDSAAQGHADDMSRRNYFDHFSPEGAGPLERASAVGYSGALGENIAAGGTHAREIFAGWMASEGHCLNILGEFQHLGLGLAPSGEARWVQLFGGRTGSYPGAGVCPAQLGEGVIRRQRATIELDVVRRVGTRLVVRGRIDPRRSARVSVRVLRGTRVVASRRVRARAGRFRAVVRLRTARAVRVRATTPRTSRFTSARTTRRVRAR
jgi:hypothetical protein